MEDLTARGRQILQAIIEDYIHTAEPVGSRAVTKRHGMSISPATVRNVMSDLEEMGFLASPHTSAGRVPTEKAYRLYVDALLGVRAGNDPEEQRLREACRISGRDVSDILREAGRILSSMSNYMGIVMVPRFTDNIFRQIEFVRLGGRRLLAILVSDSGIVQNRLIETAEDFRQEDLVRMSNYLNELLQGLPVSEVKSRILREMQSDKIRYDALLEKALKLSQETLPDEGADVIIEGQANIFDQPEFADVGKMKEIFRAFEEKSRIVDLLDRCLTAEGVQIFIGSETHLSPLDKMSVITSTYMSGNRKLGVLGVIGPTRMGYASVIPIVDYTAKLVTRLLETE